MFMRLALLLFMSAIATAAHAVTFIDPGTLQTPSDPTCIDLKEPLVVDAYQTIFKWHWTYTLAAGPYIAEKTDAKGTYYRGSPGGIAVTGPHSRKGAVDVTYDGGFYIPNDPHAVAAVYDYDSLNHSVPVQKPPSDADCSSAGYLKDPATSKLRLFAYGAGGALGGAAGGTLGRARVAHSRLSYGQAAGVGAAGGLVGGLIIGAILEHEAGKIVFIPGVADQDSLRKLRTLAAGKTALKEINGAAPPPAAAGH
jgi:hypothetical protein